MRRLQALAIRLALAGLASLSLGIVMVVASLAHSSGTPAFADSAPYELYCPGTPVGNIALNGVVTTGTITPASPAAGSTFNLTNYQSTVSLPSAIVAAAAALGNSAITGTAALKVDATGATPASVAAPPIAINAPIPSPVPPTGLSLVLPSTPGTVGPFTASGGAVTLTVDPAIALTLVVSGSDLNLTCTPYPNNSAATGIVSSPPSGAEVSPVIAVANGGSTTTTSTTTPPTSSTTTPPTSITGPYELYCPSTPVGNIALNDAVTSATLSPAAPTAGQSFSITGYQTVVNLPQSLAAAAAAVSPGQPLAGSATAQIDASGATPATTPEGPLAFSVPVPSPIPAAGVSLSLPSTPATIAGFTATSGPITIEEDASASLSLTVAGNALALTCMAYPNDDVPESGITTTAPTGGPIAPVIAAASSVSTTTTTTTTSTTTTTPSTTTTIPSTTTTGGAATTTTTVAPTTTTSARPPKTTTSTAPNTSGASSTSSTSAHVVTASSGTLAFTGPGPSLKTATIIGAALMLLGLLMLLLADIPRRLRSQLAYASSKLGRTRTADGTQSMEAGPAVALREGARDQIFVDGSGKVEIGAEEPESTAKREMTHQERAEALLRDLRDLESRVNKATGFPKLVEGDEPG